MKIISKILKSFTIVIICFLWVNPISATPKAIANSGSYVVIEKTTGRVLYENNSTQKAYMASTTKILTAITVINNFDLKTEVKVPKECVGIEGSSIYLQEGEIFTVEDLLYGLMLRSGNDAAETLAVTLSGNVESFVNLMNQTAKRLGATQSNFTNPHGLHNDNHYTTAYDLALITSKALSNPSFAKIASCKSYTAIEKTSNIKRTWTNKNKMLFSFQDATGVKTGFTKKAGRCLVSSAKRNGMELICVVLNEQNHYEVSKKLLNDAFETYRLIKVIDSKKFDYSIPNKSKSKYYKLTINEDLVLPIGKNEKFSVETVLPQYFENHLDKNQKVGEIKIYASKQLIFSQNIYTLIND